MKVKSLYNVMPRETKIFICRDVTYLGEIVDLEVLYKGTFGNASEDELQIWTEEVDIEPEEKCLIIKAKSKESTVDGKGTEVVKKVSESDSLECPIST